jgi:hypothetical protein
MADNTDIKNANSYPARADNLIDTAGKTIDNTQLGRLQDAIAAHFDYPGGGAWPQGRPDSNDAAALSRDFLKKFVLAVEAAQNPPADWDA